MQAWCCAEVGTKLRHYREREPSFGDEMGDKLADFMSTGRMIAISPAVALHAESVALIFTGKISRHFSFMSPPSENVQPFFPRRHPEKDDIFVPDLCLVQMGRWMVLGKENLQQGVKAGPEFGRLQSAAQMLADPAGITPRKGRAPLHKIRTSTGQNGKIYLILHPAIFETFYHSDCWFIAAKFRDQEDDRLERRLGTRQTNALRSSRFLLGRRNLKISAAPRNGATESPEKIQTENRDGDSHPGHNGLFSPAAGEMSSPARTRREKEGAGPRP